jgi:hypothetical protein
LLGKAWDGVSPTEREIVPFRGLKAVGNLGNRAILINNPIIEPCISFHILITIDSSPVVICARYSKAIIMLPGYLSSFDYKIKYVSVLGFNGNN